MQKNDCESSVKTKPAPYKQKPGRYLTQAQSSYHCCSSVAANGNLCPYSQQESVRNLAEPLCTALVAALATGKSGTCPCQKNMRGPNSSATAGSTVWAPEGLWERGEKVRRRMMW